jgi:deoxycytidine triphosphate deaminase
MIMLTASEIGVQITLGEIAWPGELRGDGLLLRLGSPLQPLADPGQVIDLASQDSINTLYPDPLNDWDEFELAPGRMALCAAAESLRLGAGFAAAIASLSHLARVGLATHVTSPWVMPGWDGHLAFELVNAGPATLRLHPGMPVARAVIWGMDGAASQPVPHACYGRPANLGSRYAEEFGSGLTAVDARA